VRKDVLEREAGDSRPGVAAAPAAPAISAPVTALPAGAEKALLQLLLSGDPWRPRVLEAVAPEDFEFPPYRAVFEAVADDAPERLDDTAARAFEELKVSGLGPRDPDELFTRALSWIEARGLARQVEAIDRELPLADEEEKLRLVLQKRQISAEMNARYPKYKIATRRH